MNKISYLKNTKKLIKDEKEYIIKNKTTNNNIYRYLKSKGFNNFLLPVETSDDYEIYDYINEIDQTKEEKSQELIYLLAILHNKTTSYENINLDEIKEEYESIQNKIADTRNYYLFLQDKIESLEYMSPAQYLLIRNISNIYQLLGFSKDNIDKWYEEISKKRKIRKVLLHNNISLDHFLKNEESYFIDWNDSKRGEVVYDFIKFYQKELLNVDIESLYEIYQNKYRYNQEEQYIFFSLISIPQIIKLNKSNYYNTLNTRFLIDYLNITKKFISKEYKEEQKTNKEEFKE